MSKPAPRTGVLQISPYIGGASTAPGATRVFKLSSNETPLGPSPHVAEAVRGTLDSLHRYPDGSAEALRQSLAHHYGIEAARIVCGAGSDELLGLLAQCYLKPGDETLHSAHGFSVFRIVTQANDGIPVPVPERDLCTDVDAILAAVTARTRIVFLANPNNPTGTYVPLAELRRLQAGLPAHVLLVLDAAYAEYVERDDYDAGIALVRESENVVMTRTFSKIYGLAAMRAGWAYCPALVAETLNRVRHPFNLSTPAQAAALAALEDTAFTEAARAHNARWRPWLADELQRIGLEVTPSEANFLLVHFPDTPGRQAADAHAWLMQEGLILRRMESYNLPGALRVSVGTEEANRTLIETLTAFMEERTLHNG